MDLGFICEFALCMEVAPSQHLLYILQKQNQAVC
jgi:hypothetical protein